MQGVLNLDCYQCWVQWIALDGRKHALLPDHPLTGSLPSKGSSSGERIVPWVWCVSLGFSVASNSHQTSMIMTFRPHIVRSSRATRTSDKHESTCRPGPLLVLRNVKHSIITMQLLRSLQHCRSRPLLFSGSPCMMERFCMESKVSHTNHLFTIS
jgi:hypothetical protein